jgi:glycosyltransferase involved in cell wall biosynthesis
MACGKPIVATNVGTIPEIFNHARCGELVNPGSPEELSQAIIRLLSNPPRRKRMGKRGSIAVDDYSWKSIATMILKAIMMDRSRILHKGGN